MKALRDHWFRRLSAVEPPADKPFNLLRWFSVFSFLAIVAVVGGSTWLITRHLTHNLLLRDAVVSRDFLEGVLSVDVGRAFFEQPPEKRDMARLDTFIKHMTSLTGLVAAAVYGPDSIAVWSSEPDFADRRFASGDQLQRALRGYVVVEWGSEVTRDAEHFRQIGYDVTSDELVSMYLPIRGRRADDIFAVVKLSSTPHALFDAIADDVWLVQASAVTGGAVLYLAFFGIIYRADQTLRRQREQLREQEAMATIGEMSATVAHSIRNPLAAIRAAAELARVDADDANAECLDDIIHETDRLNGWVSELLLASRSNVELTEHVDLNEVIGAALQGRAGEAALRKITVTFDQTPLPPIVGSRALLSHAILNAVSNAIEAMTQGGDLRVRTHLPMRDQIKITIEDTGPGIPQHLLQRVFHPMFTTKPNGTGLGLALTRRIIERHAGRIDIRNVPGRGALVEMFLSVRS